VNGVFKLDQRINDGERAANDVLNYLGKKSENILLKSMLVFTKPSISHGAAS
jgi:hypothetical protein